MKIISYDHTSLSKLKSLVIVSVTTSCLLLVIDIAPEFQCIHNNCGGFFLPIQNHLCTQFVLIMVDKHKHKSQLECCDC